MKKIEYELGQRVRLNGRASLNEGLEGVVTRPLADKVFTVDGVMKRMQTYLVRLDNGTVHDVVPEVLEVAPPRSRGDTDRKVAWESLPEGVVLAMKGASSGS